MPKEKIEVTGKRKDAFHSKNKISITVKVIISTHLVSEASCMLTELLSVKKIVADFASSTHWKIIVLLKYLYIIKILNFLPRFCRHC